MTFNSPPKLEKNTLKREHLSDPRFAIISCVADVNAVNEKGVRIIDIIREKFTQNKAINVNYAQMPSSQGIVERDRFGISLNYQDKFSEDYVDCTGIVVCGKEKETGKNISLMTHQNPKTVQGNHNNKNLFYKTVCF